MIKHDLSKLKCVAFQFIIFDDLPIMNVPVIDLTTFVELTLLTIILDYSGVVKAHNCSVTIIKNKIFADCSYRDMGVCVPQDLHPDVTHIDLSGNTWRDLGNGKNFDKYTHLDTLIMRNMMYNGSFAKPTYLFKNAYSLEIVDFSGSFIDYSSILFAWPPNIRIIYYADNPYIKNLEVDNLKKLEKLYASGISAMKKFPIFHELASLIVIDIKENPVEDVSTETISNFCNLEHFNFTPTTNLSYCECRKLKLWMINYRIKAGSPFSCGKHSGSSNCDLKFTSKEVDKRKNCFAKGMMSHTTSHLYIILPLILIILLSLLIPSYLYAKRYRAVKHRLHHPKKQKFSPVVAADEEELYEDDQ